jgi:uncharacterized membrane protein YeaQ/YmgE (transglycosylase-associated protein family)
MIGLYGVILWVAIGSVAGWVGSKLIGVSTRPGTLLYVAAGVTGGLLGGFLDRSLFHGARGEGGLFATFGGPLLGAAVLVLVLKLVVGGRRLAH